MPDGGSVSKKRCLGLCRRNRGGGAKSVLGRSCVPQGLALAHGNFPPPLALGQKLRQKGYPMGLQEQENGRAAEKEQALKELEDVKAQLEEALKLLPTPTPTATATVTPTVKPTPTPAK